jgi:hypothetical protein
MAEQTKRQELESYLAARALQDPGFREKLLQAPKQTIESEISLHFPITLEIKVHEEKLNELHVVLPIDIETYTELPSAESDSREVAPLPFWKRISRRKRIG